MRGPVMAVCLPVQEGEAGSATGNQHSGCVVRYSLSPLLPPPDLPLSPGVYGRLIGSLPSNITCMPQHKVASYSRLLRF